MKTKINKEESIDFFVRTHPSARQPLELLSGSNINDYPDIVAWAENKIKELYDYCEEVISEVGIDTFAEWIDFPIKQVSAVQLSLFNQS